MHVLEDEDPVAMDTAREILLSLAYLHLSEEGRAAVTTDAALALRYIEPYQSSRDMVRRGIKTIIHTLDNKLMQSERNGLDHWPRLAACRVRSHLDCERPIVKQR